MRGVEGRKQKVENLINGEKPLFLKHSHEHASRIILALAGGKEIVTPVNLPNIGQIDNLPREAVVETQAYVDALGNPSASGRRNAGTSHPVSDGSYPGAGNDCRSGFVGRPRIGDTGFKLRSFNP